MQTHELADELHVAVEGHLLTQVEVDDCQVVEASLQTQTLLEVLHVAVEGQRATQVEEEDCHTWDAVLQTHELADELHVAVEGHLETHDLPSDDRVMDESVQTQAPPVYEAPLGQALTHLVASVELTCWPEGQTHLPFDSD